MLRLNVKVKLNGLEVFGSSYIGIGYIWGGTGIIIVNHIR